MISDALRRQGVMLATPSTKISPHVDVVLDRLADSDDYIFDLKWDGTRALGYVENGKARLVNRNGVDITNRYPDVITALEQDFPRGDWVLDGEIVCFDPVTKRPSFELTMTRDRCTRAAKIAERAVSTPASFIVFDMLVHDGTDLRFQPTQTRLVLLERALSEHRTPGGGIVPSISSGDGRNMWEFVQKHELEGLIAKRKTGLYHGRRHADWIKIKPTQRATALVTGIKPGEGSRENKIGALLLSLYNDEGDLVDFGKVGTGLTFAQLAELEEAIRDAAARKELLMVEVEFQELTPDRKMRFPSYRGIRSDLLAADCTTAQLT